MKQRVFTTLVLSLTLAGIGSQANAQSEALKDAQEAASQVDLTQFFKSSNDARSQSFFFGGMYQHPFTVDTAGRYRFSSSTMPGESEDYKIRATLVDGNGNVVAKDSGMGYSGGLVMEESLEPGSYTIQVSGQKFGTTKTGGNSYNINVAQLDAEGRVLDADESSVDDGGGIMFGGASPSGRTTAFVDENDQVATLSAPGRGGDEAATAGSGRMMAEDGDATHAPSNTGVSAKPPATPDTQAAAIDEPLAEKAVESASGSGSREEPAMPDGFDEIVADILIREEGVVLSFNVAEAGTVSVTSSTFPGNEGTYRLQARILDDSGEVVASDEGSMALGDFDIETVLPSGQYQVWVKGQRFGSAMNGANNYTLRVQQLNTQ
ncbi:hypothetical protein [Salinicola aestuarinus]|uniref:hypothetical protein n=1 Tax=Salinicola aestuarinus TaxID=1949082 RepID=UPI000DA12FE2|nr:hypothetical protein [Salinicola aestuarinus]